MAHANKTPMPRGDLINGRPAPQADRTQRAAATVIMPFGNGQFTPPIEIPRPAALEPVRAINPALLPAKPEEPGLGGLSDYMRSQGAPTRDALTLFHPQPPTGAQWPRAVDSQNLAAVPPRFFEGKVRPLFKIFSKPRPGTPGHNPFGVNTTATP